MRFAVAGRGSVEVPDSEAAPALDLDDFRRILIESAAKKGLRITRLDPFEAPRHLKPADSDPLLD